MEYMDAKNIVLRVPQSKFEANRSRGSWFLIRNSNKQPEVTYIVFSSRIFTALCIPVNKNINIIWHLQGCA